MDRAARLVAGVLEVSDDREEKLHPKCEALGSPSSPLTDSQEKHGVQTPNRGLK